jgi:hypothetical protein
MNTVGDYHCTCVVGYHSVAIAGTSCSGKYQFIVLIPLFDTAGFRWKERLETFQMTGMIGDVQKAKLMLCNYTKSL